MLEKMSEMIAEQLNCDAAGITCLSWLWLWKMNTILRSRLKILQI